MQNQQWLTVGASSALAGALVSLTFYNAQPIAVLLASTAGAVGGTILVTSKQCGTRSAPQSKLTKLETSTPLNQELVNTLEQIKVLLAENKSELSSFKKQLNLAKIKEINDSNTYLNNSSNEESLSITETEDNFQKEQEGIAEIIALLATINIMVDSYKEPQEVDNIFDKIALVLGERYKNLKALHKQIKINGDEGKKFVFRVAEKSPEEISDLTNFCKLLNDKSFLSYYRYLLSEKRMIVTPQTNTKMSNFFKGDWLERFVYQKICTLLSENQIEYRVLRQVTGTFANGNDFELDLFFLINNQPLWIECKAGQDYNAYLTKYSDNYRKKLKIPKERAFLVIADLTDEQTVDYTNLWEITVANIHNFIELISNSLGLVGNEFPTPLNNQSLPQLESQEIQFTSKGKLLQFFKKKSLQPFPEHRKAVLNQLVELFKNSSEPMTLGQLKEILTEKMNLSKSKINDIFRTLLRSSCFLNESQESIASYQTPISNLISLEPAVLEQKCLEIYALSVLAIHPNYFDTLENVREFEEITGGKIPDIEAILKLNIMDKFSYVDEENYAEQAALQQEYLEKKKENDELAKEVFLEALKTLDPNKLPWNISVLHDKMKNIEPTLNLKNTSFKKFSALAEYFEAQNVIKTGRNEQNSNWLLVDISDLVKS